MNRFSYLLVIITMVATSARANEQVRQVQSELKKQGFYYGEVDGEPGTETNAAIRRYQIRNGIEVTGTLTQETLGALKVAGSPVTVTTSIAPPVPLSPASQAGPSPVTKAKRSIVQSDREFLRNQSEPGNQPTPSQRDRNVISPPVVIPSQPSDLSTQYARVFRLTPYENAPIEVQQITLKKAQLHLYREQFYGGSIDGIPGPSTDRAVADFQVSQGLSQTGRLDLATLNTLRLLPPERHAIPAPAYQAPDAEPRVYRGIWVR